MNADGSNVSRVAGTEDSQISKFINYDESRTDETDRRNAAVLWLGNRVALLLIKFVFRSIFKERNIVRHLRGVFHTRAERNSGK